MAKWRVIEDRFDVWSGVRDRVDYATLEDERTALDNVSFTSTLSHIKQCLNWFGRGYITRTLHSIKPTSFRASRSVQPNSPFQRLEDLWSPPARIVENWGRFNRPKQSVFYMSSDPLTALAEVQSKPLEHRILLVMRQRDTRRPLSFAQIGTEKIPQISVFREALGRTAGGLSSEPELQSLLKRLHISEFWASQDSVFSRLATSYYQAKDAFNYRASCLLGEQLLSISGVSGLSYPTVARDYLGWNTVANPTFIGKHFFPLEAWLVSLGHSPVFIPDGRDDPRVPLVIRRGTFDATGAICWSDDRRAQSVHTLHQEIAPRNAELLRHLN